MTTWFVRLVGVLGFATLVAGLTAGWYAAPVRAATERALIADYIFIALYALLFVLAARLVNLRAPRRTMVAGTVIVLGLAAAGFDVWENVQGAALTASAQSTRLKWLLGFGATGLLSFAFWRRGSGWLTAIAVFLAAAALLGAAGVLLGRKELIAGALLPLLAGLLMVAVTTTAYPDALVPDSRQALRKS